MNAIEMALLKKATKPSVRKDVPGELELHYGMFRMMPEGAKPHMATIEQAACMLPGVTAAEMNTSTGVFTVRYDPAQVDSARVKDWIKIYPKEMQKSTFSKR